MIDALAGNIFSFSLMTTDVVTNFQWSSLPLSLKWNTVPVDFVATSAFSVVSFLSKVPNVGSVMIFGNVSIIRPRSGN